METKGPTNNKIYIYIYIYSCWLLEFSILTRSAFILEAYVLYFYPTHIYSGMKMGNIVARVGIKPTYLALWAQCATITPCRLPDVTLYPCLPVYAALCLRRQCRLVQSSP